MFCTMSERSYLSHRKKKTLHCFISLMPTCEAMKLIENKKKNQVVFSPTSAKLGNKEKQWDYRVKYSSEGVTRMILL